MYTNETTHFGIPLPLGSDLTTPMDYNTAFEAVDEALFKSQGDASVANEHAAAAVETANATSEALGTLSTTVGTHTTQIAALGARMTNAENNIDDVRSDLEDMITAYNEPTATSTHAYSTGDYFIYNDVLYKATTSISIGETIVPNTNCMATNVTTEVKDVKSALTVEALTASNVMPGANIEAKRYGKIISVTIYGTFATTNDNQVIGKLNCGMCDGFITGTTNVGNFFTITAGGEVKQRFIGSITGTHYGTLLEV